MVWNEFGDPDREDPFHEATFALLDDGPRSPFQGLPGQRSFALNVNARRSAFGRCGRFSDLAWERRFWDLVLDPDEVVALYATYSHMTARPPDERRAVLAKLREIAADQFAGCVTRNMVTILYTARRR